MEFSSAPRPSPIAGTWYSGNPEMLAKQMDAFIEKAVIQDEDVPGKVIGIIVPHAGHRYSGRTAGYAYKAVKGDARDLVVVLSPFHPYAPAAFLTTGHAAYRTPLGDIPVAEDLLDALERALEAEDISMQQMMQDEEHSVEIQLPFLQRAWQDDFRLLPVMVRSQDAQQLERFARALHAVIADQRFLLVASTDLSHYQPLQIAEQLDAEMLRRIQEFDPRRVLSAEREGKAFACGAGAVAAVLWAAARAGADTAGILNYSTSADVTGDTTSVVGYGAAVLTRNKRSIGFVG